MEYSINGWDKLPTINRKRIIISFSTFSGVSLFLYTIYQFFASKFSIGNMLLNILYNDIPVLLTVIICLIISFCIIYLPAKKIPLSVSTFELTVGEIKYKTSNIITWSVIDLGDYLEFIIKTDIFTSPFVYFYVPFDSLRLDDFIADLNQILPYQDNIQELDRVHLFFRTLGLK